ncbi:MAG: alpha/beta hydrolase [Ruminococcaceae bacterium]|nr:alpha/beta hydrolase [Oscillospiraceae bacterium]
MKNLYSCNISLLYGGDIVNTIFIILGFLLFVIIILAVASYLAFRTAIVRRPDVPFEVLETMPDTAWCRFRAEIREGISWVESMPKTTLTTLSYDGLKLYGTLIENENPKATLLMFHGYRSSGINDFSCAAKFYYSLGFNLLIVDQRAHGRSEGKYIGFGATERFDCRTWADLIYERYGKDLPILITGISMGGATVLMASSLKLPENVVAIISDSAFTSPADILSHVIRKNYHINPSVIMPFMNIWSKILAKYSFYDVSTEDTMKETKIPILFIHGLSDDFVPCEMSKRSLDACRAEKTSVFVENAGHGESYLVDKKRCEEALKGFIGERLGL